LGLIQDFGYPYGVWEMDSVKIYSSSWDIPKEMQGGEYKLKINGQARYVAVPYQILIIRFLSAERKFSIRSYRNPQLNIDIDFVERGYRPNDTVLALVKVGIIVLRSTHKIR
jgi:hypothetical protein